MFYTLTYMNAYTGRYPSHNTAYPGIEIRTKETAEQNTQAATKITQ